MDTTSENRMRIPVGDLRSALPKLAVLLALLAVLLAWSGVRQWRDAGQLEGIERARDQAVELVQARHAAQVKQLEQRLASAPVKAALAANDTAAAIAAVREGWTGVEQVEILDGALQAAYGDAATFGYSKLALLEAGMQGNAVATRVVKDGKQTSFGMATAVPQGVLYVRVPLAHLTEGFDGVAMPAGGYLALRQGAYSIQQRGDSRLEDGAERMAHAVGKTSLRVATAAPDSESGPLGLGAIPALVVAALLAGLAIAALVVARGGVRVGRFGSKGAEMHDMDEPTLGEALQREPLPAAATRPAATAEGEGQGAYRQSEGKAVDVDPGIFRAYDIRGIVGKSLSVEVAELIGLAIGSLMRDEDLTDIVVGRDGRLSGPDLVGGLIEGLRKTGRNVIDIGLAPTPVAYFGAYHLRAGSCVAVTGSHNPPDYNGFKIVVGGQTLSGGAITDLYERIRDRRLYEAPMPGDLQQRDITADYIQRIADDVQLERPLKIVVDAGNGVAGDIAPQLLEAIGADVIPLYCEVDGTFPNHHPDPSEPHNLEDLIQTVKRFDADIGLAFDGDGDRLGVVTKEGEIIFPDRLLMLFAADVLERNPGALIIYDVKCTGKLQGWVLRHGGTPMMWKTGHSLIKAKMRESGAELAGEMSGHFFFQERWYGFDDGLYSAARLLEILANRVETPSEVLADLPNGVSTPEIKVDVVDGTPHAIVERFVDGAEFEGARLSTIDGLRADWDDGWGLVRASNTTPILVLRFEADNKAALERIKTEFRTRLQALAPELKMTF
ncbi:phosphomannomutase/phosphoglucomutase [Pseudoxanthomonas japonensis]|uniref:phosphomannomutase/phosphoglucomutase n=1 Tax=Pseudoxanthomonas japonensis TaxID=69284 RepID=UPI0028545CFB|nr:phosphomannomutase/phosphoglucomutase [Pseudoxanthomonas japonensis]MDR7068351.1 phosphomannomutase/phosphoglucomutase [Pseudoxanthomonas japonensis]